MENLKFIKNRIKTVDSIIKATNAMKMVSTVKLSRVNNSNSCAKRCAGILFDMFSRALREVQFRQETDELQWLMGDSSKKTLFVVLSTDQGFCGSFKQLIYEEAKRCISAHHNVIVETFGRKASDLGLNRVEGLLPKEVTSRYDIPAYSHMISELVFRYIKDHEVGEVFVVCGEFKNVLVQRARCISIFPIEKTDVTKTPYTTIEGDSCKFIESVFKMYLSKLFVGIVTEHLIAELSARVMAMDNSVRNANDMFVKLNGLYNRVRQSKITQELTEIVSSIECVQ